MSYNPFSLEGKTILITGASSGIGKATAIECSKLGARCIITGRNEKRLSETYSLLEGEGHLQIVSDLSDFSQIQKLVDQIPVVNGLVNNAGISKHLPVNFVTEEKIDEIFPINLTAPILLFSKLLKSKKMARPSSAVFTSSINGLLVGEKSACLYSTTKAGISGFVKVCAHELASKGIRVNCVCPGMIETSILSEGTITKEQLAENAKGYPLGRHGKPEEVAWGIIYLLSDASSFVTGTNLVIDGGISVKI